MATWEQLRDKALKLVDQLGVTDAENVASVALEECLNYVSSKVQLDDLIGRATYTWVDGDTEVEVGTGGFNVEATLVTPLFLFVGDEADSGHRYDYRRWLDWLSLQFSASREREALGGSFTNDARPDHCFTIDPDNNVNIYPVPAADDVLTLYFEKDTAGYGNGSGTPELPGKFQNILVSGAVLVLKDWLREPEQFWNPHELFTKLDDQIRELEIHLRGNGARPKMKLNRSVRAC